MQNWIYTIILVLAVVLLVRMWLKNRRLSQQLKFEPEADEAFHKCRACGITDETHPDVDFRYCPDCHGMVGYCPEHLYCHDHVMEKDKY